jgi:hypothetical protein
MPVTLWYDGPYWCTHIHPEIAVPGEGGRGDKTRRDDPAAGPVPRQERADI